VMSLYGKQPPKDFGVWHSGAKTELTKSPDVLKVASLSIITSIVHIVVNYRTKLHFYVCCYTYRNSGTGAQCFGIN